MNLVFMGTPHFAVPILKALAGRHNVLCVYCQPPRPAGRGKQDRPSPVQVCAEALGLAVRHPRSLREPEDQRAFVALGAEVAVVAAYGLLLPQPILDAPEKGCLNVHASLLPRWRGAAPIHRAIMAGDVETGVCIMRMEAGLDTGPVLLRRVTPIGAEETTADLHDRLAMLGAQAIVEALDRLGSLVPERQPAEGVTYASKIDKAEARIDFARSAIEVDRQIRGLSPYPGAWVEVNGERLKLLRSRIAVGAGVPGTVLRNTTIACGEGAVEITLAQREGRRPMSATELLHGWGLPARL